MKNGAEKQVCEMCEHFIMAEYREKYDGIWDYVCMKDNHKVCRWILNSKGQRIKENNNAFNDLWSSCPLDDLEHKQLVDKWTDFLLKDDDNE